MSFDTFWSADEEDLFRDEQPAWLVRFVKDDLRPFLLAHRPTATAAVERCLDDVAAMNRAIKDNAERRQLYAARFIGKKLPKRPPPGLVFGRERVSRGKGMSPESTMVEGYFPPDLSADRQPQRPGPLLPPPANRDLTDDECWTALVGVHDAIRDEAERFIGAGSLHFHGRVHGAGQLKSKHLPDLERMFKRVNSSVAEPSLLASKNQKPPKSADDGFNDTDRYILRTLLSKGAINREARMTSSALAKDSGVRPGTIRSRGTILVAESYLNSDRTTGGGYWLTAKGKKAAAKC